MGGVSDVRRTNRPVLRGEATMSDEPGDLSTTTQTLGGVVVVRPPAEVMSRLRLPYFVGVSGATTGAQGLSLTLLVIPPGGAAEPHIHQGYETAIYLLQGRVETRYGAGLRQSTINVAGDFIYIAPDVWRQPVNLSADGPAMALVARNDPNEQESVVLYDPASEG